MSIFPGDMLLKYLSYFCDLIERNKKRLLCSALFTALSLSHLACLNILRLKSKFTKTDSGIDWVRDHEYFSGSRPALSALWSMYNNCCFHCSPDRTFLLHDKIQMQNGNPSLCPQSYKRRVISTGCSPQDYFSFPKNIFPYQIRRKMNDGWNCYQPSKCGFLCNESQQIVVENHSSLPNVPV